MSKNLKGKAALQACVGTQQICDTVTVYIT